MYAYTSQAQLRKEFWVAYPDAQREKIGDYSGYGTVYCTDTRCAFNDWIDFLSKRGEISQDLAQRVTL